MATRTVAGIAVPDTPLITASLEFARKHLHDWSYNHVVRSWLLGTAIADRIPDLIGRDKELHAIAAILHDQGWDETDTLVSKDKCFEVDGADAARTFIEHQASAADWDKYRIQLMWDAIALHTLPPIALHKEPEVKATHLGILADFVGPDGIPGGALTQEEFASVSKQFPRSGFKSGVVQKMCGFCKTKPEATYGTFVADFGEDLVEGYTEKGHRLIDLIQHATVDAD